MHAFGHRCTHTRKLDRVWIITALVQSVQSASAQGSETHLAFLLYRRRPCCNGLCAAVLSVSVEAERGVCALCRRQLGANGRDRAGCLCDVTEDRFSCTCNLFKRAQHLCLFVSLNLN